MKNNKHIQRFNEHQENLNISDVRRSFSFTYDDLEKAFNQGISQCSVGPSPNSDESGYLFNKWFNKWFDENYV